ncbi:Reticulon-like protein B11 [Linum perenne]
MAEVGEKREVVSIFDDVVVPVRASWIQSDDVRGERVVLSRCDSLLVGEIGCSSQSYLISFRPLPPIPDMEITEENVDKIVQLTQGYVNKVLAIGCDIAVERKLKVFLKVSFVSWIVSYVGSLCSFLTFVYIGVLLSLSIPVLYDRFQHQIDEKLLEARRIRDAQLRNLLKKIPVPSKKDKKVQ